MLNYPLINAPNQTVLLDFSAYDTANYAGSEIAIAVASQNTTLILPPAINVNGYPCIYIFKNSGLKVKCGQTDFFTVGAYPNREINYDEVRFNNILVLTFKKVLSQNDSLGIWMPST